MPRVPAESLGVQKSASNVAATFFSTVNLFQKDLSFEHGVRTLYLALGIV